MFGREPVILQFFFDLRADGDHRVCLVEDLLRRPKSREPGKHAEIAHLAGAGYF